jgi:hypothetical protein
MGYRVIGASAECYVCVALEYSSRVCVVRIFVVYIFIAVFGHRTHAIRHDAPPPLLPLSSAPRLRCASDESPLPLPRAVTLISL